MLLISLFFLVHASSETYHKALRFTQEQTTFEQPELEPFVTYHAMVDFKKVRLTTWDGTQILREVWVTPTDPDDTMVDVQVDPRLSNDLRLTVIPELSSHIVGYSGLIRARHVTMWVPNETTKKYWDTWLAKQMEAYRSVAEI